MNVIPTGKAGYGGATGIRLRSVRKGRRYAVVQAVYMPGYPMDRVAGEQLENTIDNFMNLVYSS